VSDATKTTPAPIEDDGCRQSASNDEPTSARREWFPGNERWVLRPTWTSRHLLPPRPTRQPLREGAVGLACHEKAGPISARRCRTAPRAVLASRCSGRRATDSSSRQRTRNWPTCGPCVCHLGCPACDDQALSHRPPC